MDDRILGKLAEILGIDPQAISPSDQLSDLELDSLDQVELVMALEDKFGIELDDSEVASIRTVQEVIDAIKRNGG
jgi:acyl carrier protein